MTFKQNWEKTDLNYQLSAEMIDGMLALAFPEQKVHSKELISGGCANLNYRITLAPHEKPKILRVYLRVGRDSDEKDRLLYNFKSIDIQPLISLYSCLKEIHHSG